MNIDDIIKEMRVQERAGKLLESKGLNPSLTKQLVLSYYFKVREITIASQLGIHLKTVKRYYEILGTFTESEFRDIMKLCHGKNSPILI